MNESNWKNVGTGVHEITDDYGYRTQLIITPDVLQFQTVSNTWCGADLSKQDVRDLIELLNNWLKDSP